MKSDIKENVKKDTTKYPCLKHVKNEWGMCVVLFTANNTGVVVYTTMKYWYVGEYREDWIEPNFTLFDGTITLSND